MAWESAFSERICMRKEYEEKPQAGEIVVKNKFLTWLDNFWYHYKWPFLIGSFFLIVAIVSFSQCSVSKGDVVVRAVFCGDHVMTTEERDGIEDVLTSLLAEDKKRQVSVNPYTVYTEEQLRAQYTNEKGEFDSYGYQFGKQRTVDALSTFSSYLLTGDCAVFFVSEYVYEQQNMDTLARPLTDTFGQVPTSAHDAYTLRLGDLDIYREFEELQVLPPDTLVLLTHSYVWGSSKDPATYEEFVALFKAIAAPYGA